MAAPFCPKLDSGSCFLAFASGPARRSCDHEHRRHQLGRERPPRGRGISVHGLRSGRGRRFHGKGRGARRQSWRAQPRRSGRHPSRREDGEPAQSALGHGSGRRWRFDLSAGACAGASRDAPHCDPRQCGRDPRARRGVSQTSHGVDSGSGSVEALESAQRLADKTGAVVVLRRDGFHRLSRRRSCFHQGRPCDVP